MAQTEAAVVRKQIVVDAPVERAFTVFTERFGDFKPPEHNLLGVPVAETVFEPRAGGSITDRAPDGSTGTSTGMAPGGKRSPAVWTARRAGRCTWTATPRW
jgi:hypothetical protein